MDTDGIKLIKEAESIPYMDYHLIDTLIERAISKETKERLRSILLMKRMQDRYHAYGSC